MKEKNYNLNFSMIIKSLHLSNRDQHLKRQYIGWHKIFASHVINKELLLFKPPFLCRFVTGALAD